MLKIAKKGRLKSRILILSGALAVLCLEALLLPKIPIWITDNGNKYIILRNFATQGNAEIANPAKSLDSESRSFPDGGFHFQRLGTKIFSIYPEFFSLLALPGYLLLGDAGLLFIPIVGTLTLLALFLALIAPWRLSVCQETLLVGILLVGTPLLFYSGTFWEMTVSAVFPLAALLAARKKRIFFAGLLLGMGLFFREEFYLIALFFGVSALCLYPKKWKNYIEFALGFFICAILLWMHNFYTYGHILGLHGALYYTHNSESAPTLTGQLVGILEGYFIYLFKFNSANPDTVYYYYILLLPMFILPVAGALRSMCFKKVVAIAALCSWAILFGMLMSNPAKVSNSGLTVGFITASPLLLGFFLMWKNLLSRGSRPVRMITLAVLLYCIVLPAILTRSDIGIIWGPRHYLLIYPILLALSVIGFVRLGWLKKPIPKIVTSVVLLSVFLQLLGIYMLFGVAKEAARAEQAIAGKTPEVVVSDVFFLPEMTPRLFFEKKWLFVKNDTEFDALIMNLKSAGVNKFTLVLSPHFRSLSDWAIAKGLACAPLVAKPERILAPMSGFLELLIGECRLQ
ncbi:MAG: hypothetical protein LBM70_09105 [Victivallales bacterium]|nr:hypothetical protein [Victivallales bacterium]